MPRQRSKIHKNLILLVAVVVAVSLGSTSLDVYVNYQNALKTARAQNLGYARALAEHASRTFGEADLALTGTIEQVERNGGIARMSEHELHRLFLAQRRQLPQIASIFAVNERGILVAASYSYPIKRIDVARSDHFRFQRENVPQQPFLSLPYKSKLDGAWRFSITRRISSADGSFQGYLGVALSEHYFDSFYSTLSATPAKRIALLKDDGSCLAVAPFDERALAQPLDNRQLFEALSSRLSAGSFRKAPGRDDHGGQIASYSRIPGEFPAIALVSLDKEAALAEWRRDALTNGGMSALFLACIVALALVLARRLKQLERSEEALQQSEETFRQIFDRAPDPILLIDDTGCFVDCNSAAIGMLGATSKNEVLMRHPSFFSPQLQPDGRSSAEKADQIIRAVFDDSRNMHFEWLHQRIDHSQFYVEVSLRLATFGGRNMQLVHWRDITERKQAESALRKLSTAVEQSPAAIVITDYHGLIEYVNPKFCELTEYASEEVLGKNARILKAGSQPEEHYRDLWETITAGREWQGEFHNKSKSGRLFWEDARISPIRDPDGSITHFVAVKEDVTERKRLQEELSRMAHFDELTRLPNRSLFFERAFEALTLAKRENRCLGFLFIDLDGFKAVNDTHGHEAGDAVLVEAAKRLTACLRESDTVARMGGDEFTVILRSLSRGEDAAVVAEKLLAVLTTPFVIPQGTCTVGASIGVSIFPDHADNVEELLRVADGAMYDVKRSGKNNYRYPTDEP